MVKWCENQIALQIYLLKLIAVIDNMELFAPALQNRNETVESFDEHSVLLLSPHPRAIWKPGLGHLIMVNTLWGYILKINDENSNSDHLCDSHFLQTCHDPRLATRVIVVAPLTFLMMQQRTCTICNPELIAIFARLEKNLKGQSDCKDAKLFHFIG